MKTKEVKVKYEAWLNTETMHNSSVKWLSELKFAKDEQLFFDDLIKSYTLQLIDSKHYKESKKIIDKLSDFQTKTDSLIKTIVEHEKGLKIMADGINQIEQEEIYKKEHGKLIIVVSYFLEKYRALKAKLFSHIKSIIKEGKQKLLLQ
ncbi:hypothetical protein EV196_105263 [Mariniflexile fucanivorans]|uniref:Uncharacterized protein n=1 Tax=Mariniflexile fucanivorans TaxID=264023 RepID=A0A4R1RIK2_9FLAO|nr:hypothetical protein [Mariniflexile fucanivorans]TCL65600.1 hypothetical protein EV196_105263 [Mariniflexile fucanivorans]